MGPWLNTPLQVTTDFRKKMWHFVVFILFVWDYHHDAHVQYADVVVESGESQKLS